MHQAVEEILPCVEDEDGEEELKARDEDVVDELGAGQFPGGESGNLGLGGEEGIVSSCQGASEKRMRGSHILGEGSGIDTEEAQQTWQGTLDEAQARSPDGDVVVGLARHLWGLGEGEQSARDDLDDLMNNDIAGDLVAGDMIPAQNLVGCVETVLGEEIKDVDNVEDHGHNPVYDHGGEDVEPGIGDPRQEILLRRQGIFRQRRQASVEEGVVGGHVGGGRAVDHGGGRCAQ